MANSEPTVFKNVCPLDCPDTCSMGVTVQECQQHDLVGADGYGGRATFFDNLVEIQSLSATLDD